MLSECTGGMQWDLGCLGRDRGCKSSIEDYWVYAGEHGGGWVDQGLIAR